MKRFNEEVYTGSPKVNLSCFREFDELERCLRYSDLKKFMVCACLILFFFFFFFFFILGTKISIT